MSAFLPTFQRDAKTAAWLARYAGWYRDGEDRDPPRRRESTTAMPKKRCFTDASGRELKRPAIQGFAAIFDTTFRYGGGNVFFQQGCIRDIYEGGKKLLLDHNEARQVGSTALGLEFANTCSANPVNGLAFRMPLSDDNEDSQVIYDTISSLERPCVSVGIEIEESEVIRVKDVDVKIVMRASLSEISLVPLGAVPGTNASIVDLMDHDPWLLMAARSNTFVSDKYVSNVDASAKRLVDKLAKLKA